MNARSIVASIIEISIAAIGFSIISCATPAILRPNPHDYPCGVHGIECGHGLCCDEGDVCGSSGPWSTCPPGACCYVGEDTLPKSRAPRKTTTAN